VLEKNLLSIKFFDQILVGLRDIEVVLECF
jgi:hypothetical protein